MAAVGPENHGSSMCSRSRRLATALPQDDSPPHKPRHDSLLQAIAFRRALPDPGVDRGWTAILSVTLGTLWL